MKKILLVLILLFGSVINTCAETKRIISGKESAKITIIAYESLTCSHCANFHKDIYPQLKKDYIDTGLAKIEFRHFPLGAIAFNAAKVSQCNQEEGLEILESLYSNQEEWIKGNTIEEAKKNGSPVPITELIDGYYAKVQEMGGNRWDSSSLIALLKKKK